MGYYFRLTTRVLLYAPSHRQDSTHHGLCYTSRGALAATKNSSMGLPHEGSIRRSIAPWANFLTTELHLAPWRERVRSRSVEKTANFICSLRKIEPPQWKRYLINSDYVLKLTYCCCCYCFVFAFVFVVCFVFLFCFVCVFCFVLFCLLCFVLFLCLFCLGFGLCWVFFFFCCLVMGCFGFIIIIFLSGYNQYPTTSISNIVMTKENIVNIRLRLQVRCLWHAVVNQRALLVPLNKPSNLTAVHYQCS